MSRPDVRPMHRLPVLEAKRASLETCVFCPKLCRSACPVSNIEPTETLTPWGKMSAAYFVAGGAVPATESFARTSLACTSCHACRELCDHENDVAGTLLTTRAAEATLGILPESARRVGRDFPRHLARTQEGVAAIAAPGIERRARTALLVGCTYVRAAPDEARAAVRATTSVLREPVALAFECCGLPLLYAGEAEAFARQAVRMAEAVEHTERLVVVDAGCASALRLRYPEVGVHVRPKVELLVELAEGAVPRMTAVAGAGEVRYHDPCQLGRGLGVYDAPRRVLTRATGRAPREFVAHGRHAACSGAGGLLPLTMPEVARGIATARQAEHRDAGGGEIVTACASSMLALRRAGPAPVSDIASWIARALPPFAP